MLTLDDLRDAVDLYHGSLRFAVPIASLAGLTSPDWPLALSYDSATVDETVTGWNLSRPTGEAGLGWSLPADRIEVERGDQLGSDQTLTAAVYTLALGGRRYRLVPAGGQPGSPAYATVPHEFWQVSYSPASESWTVTTEDGSRLVFGDPGSGRGTVDWGYAWGNWSGATMQATGRQQVATGWSLSQRTDVWGNTTTFSYAQTQGQLGGGTPVSYTQGTALTRIDGPDGSALVLRYAAKEAAEYTSPHSGAAAAAWQSRYSATVLTAVDEVAPGGTVIATTTLGYTGPGGTLAAIGTGDHTKRLLMGLVRQAPGGYQLPGLSLGYDTDPTSDSYGALTSVITEAGGEASIAYSRPALTLPRRDIVLSPPAAGAGQPRVFIGDDYAVVLWRGSDGSVQAVAYRWQGRWLPASVPAPPAADDAAYTALRVACGQGCFAIVGATQYTVFGADPAVPGGWAGSTAPEPIGLPPGEPVALAAGAGYLALAGSVSGTMTVRWFDGAAWQSLACPGPAGTSLAAIGGSAGSLVRVASGGGQGHQVLLAYPAPAGGGWATSAFTLRDPVPALDTVIVTAGDSYAVVTLAGWAGADRVIARDAAWWSPGFTGLSTAGLSRQTGAAPPGGITGPQLAGATVLAGQDVYRFDGAAWRHQDLSALTHPGQSQVAGLSAGPDLVARSVQLADGSLVYDLITYDPASTAAAPWGYAAGLSGLPARQGATTAMAARPGPAQPGAASRFVLLNNTLYLQAGDGSWSSQLAVGTVFDQTTIASLVLADSSYLVFQTATGVSAYPLAEGGLGAPGGIDLTGSKLLPAAGPPMTGQSSFAAYTGTWGDPAAVLTLYRAVAQDVRGPLTPLAVASITRYASGGMGSTGPLPYDAIPVAYDHGLAVATATDDGRALAVSHSTATEAGTSQDAQPFGSTHTYLFGRLTPAETPALPYPAGQQTNATASLGYLAGTPYAVRELSASGTEVFSNLLWWWVTRAPSGGTYLRVRTETTAADGVPSERDLSYDAGTGLVTELDATLADGTQLRTTYLYWWQAYDTGRALNLLTPVVQCLQYAGTALLRGSVTTWTSQWAAGPGRWAQQATYLATSATPASFANWAGPPLPAPQGWQLTSLIADRTSAGLAALTRDALGRSASSTHSADGISQLASFGNADAGGQEASHYNCEPYEDPAPWAYRGSTIESHLVDQEANLGTRCLQIAPDPTGATGPVAAWTPASQDRSYLFSCWAQTGAGLTEGDTTFVLSARAAGQDIGSLTLNLPATAGLWAYASAVIPLADWRAAHNVPAATQATITARGANTKAGLDVFVDGLRFQPSDADFYASVPDPATGLPLGSLAPNGVTYRLIRDANRIVTGTVGPDAATARLAIPAFARLATADGTFATAFPNTKLEADSGTAADYQNFEASDAGLWTLPAGWTVGGGQLAFSGTQPGVPGSMAVLTAFASLSYVASVRFLPPTGNPPDVGIGCGNVLAFHLAAPDAWVLATTTDGQHWTQGTPYPGPLGHGDLVFALLDGRVTVFAAGRQVFSQQVPAGITPDGGLRLCLTGPGAFADLIALTDPELRLVLIDGRGLAQQSIDLRSSDGVNALGAVTDQRGLPAYDKNAAAVALALDSGRIAGAPTSYLPPSTPTLPQYLQLGNGSPFIREVAEPAPLARLSQLGMPGDDLAVGGGHESDVAYSRNTAAGPMQGLVPDQQAGNYELVAFTDPDHGSSYRLASSSGYPTAQRTELAGGASLTEGFGTDPTGLLTSVTPPNGYAQSNIAGWQTRFTRDFLGQLVGVDSPDELQSQTGYDSAGRPRFTQSAAEAAASPAIIRYRKYDGIDRVVEEGAIPGVTWASVLPQADNAGWPDAGTPHSVSRAMSYDAPPDGVAGTCTEGRLAQLTVYAADGTTVATSESYGYDTAGRVTAQWTQAPGYSTDTWLTGFDYDSRGNMTLIRYPMAVTDGSPPLSVAYSYDRDGRIVAAGDPPPAGFIDPLNPPADTSARYGQFSYAPDGSLSSASYQNDDAGTEPITVAYTYSPAGWPLSATSPVYSEQLTYTSGGYGGAGSYRGLPASARRTYQAGGQALYPLLDYTAQYAYDPAGRLTAAAPYLAPSTPPGPGSAPLALDANGNLLTVARGDATAAYSYPRAAAPADARRDAAAGDPAQPSDRLQDVLVTLASSCTFDATPPPGWSWGASDGGPAGATVVDGGRSGGRCLSVPGGVLGMAGVLGYRGYADPRGTYTLQYWIQAGPDFAAQPGAAGWYLVLHGPAGPIASTLAAALTSPPTTWTQQTVTFSIASLYQVQGDYAQVVDVSFVLRNHRGTGGGTLGAALLVDDLVLTGSGDLGAIEYDASGRVTALAGAGLSAMSYAPDSSTLAVFRSAAAGGYTMSFALGDGGGYATREAAPADPNGVPGATVYLRAPDGRLLARQNRWGGQVSRAYYIEGPDGTFAVQDDGELSYLIRSPGSAACAVTDTGGTLTGFYDTDAFGAVQACPLNGTDVLGLLGPFSAVAPAPSAPYAPWLGRALAPLPLRCPPDTPATVAGAQPGQPGGYQPTYLDRALKLVTSAANLIKLNIVDGTRFMGHTPDGWYVKELTKTMAVVAAMRNPPVSRLFSAGMAVAALIGPYASGGLQFLSHRYWVRCAPGLLKVLNEGLLEDIYHGASYGPFEELSGARRLRLRSVEVIPDGFYIFVVTESYEFRYRDMSDRAGGTELYVRHSHLAGGECVWAAGMMAIFGDEIVLTDQSGHYGPTRKQIEDYAAPRLKEAGYGQYRITVCSFLDIHLKQLMVGFRERTGRA